MEEFRKSMIDYYIKCWSIPDTRWEINQNYSVNVYGNLRITLYNGELPFKLKNYRANFSS